MDRNSIAGVVLAGGRSSRMGFDKAMADLAGRPLVAHAVARLAPQVAAMAISSNEGGEAFAALGLPLVPDRDPNRPGPLAGILAAMEWAAASGHGFVVTAPVDSPFAPADLVERLAAGADDGTIAIATSGKRPHPAFGLWPVALAPKLARHLAEAEDRSVIRFARAAGMRLVEFPLVGGRDPFFNVNTPDDLDEARRLLAEAVT